MAELSKRQSMIDDKISQVKQLRTELENKEAEVTRVKEELAERQQEVQQLQATLQKKRPRVKRAKEIASSLLEDKKWILQRGMGYALDMFHSSDEYRDKLELLASTGDAVGMQE